MLEEDALLAPISDTQPTGEDLSFSAEFDRIIEYRRADDPTLDQGAWQTDIKYADWSSMLRDCNDLLQHRTKDLRLAGWLVESATQLEGYAGLASGLRVVAGLCQRYWDDVHPQAPDGDQEERIGNLSWLLANALQWVRNVPIVSAPQGRFSLADHEHAHSRAHAEAGEHHTYHDEVPSLELLEAARRDTPHDFYRTLIDVLPACSLALAELQVAVDERLGLDGPSFTALREQLDTVTRTAHRFARESGLLIDGAPPVTDGLDDSGLDSSPASGATAAVAAGASAPRGPAGAPTTRREALQQLRQVAEFFRQTEPHSPVAYLAEKAARWGEMPLHVWLKRVIKDHTTLEQMQELLDVDNPQDN